MNRNDRSVGDPLEVDLERLPFDTDRGIGARAALGLLVLETDQTIEDEFRAVWPDQGVALYAARLHNDVQITPETLKEMEGLIAPTTRLLPFMVDLSVIAFACTSGSLVIGEQRVAERVRSVRPDTKVTDPVTAAIAALRATGVKRVALLTPYLREINLRLRAALLERGLQIPVMGAFNEPRSPCSTRSCASAARRCATGCSCRARRCAWHASPSRPRR